MSALAEERIAELRDLRDELRARLAQRIDELGLDRVAELTGEDVDWLLAVYSTAAAVEPRRELTHRPGGDA